MSFLYKLYYLNTQTADCKYDNDPAFRTFKRQLYHSSIAAILQPLREAMTKPVIRRCPDGHFRRIIYDLAAFIADYPEQVLLAGIVQNWCPKFVILISIKSATIDSRYQMLDVLQCQQIWMGQVVEGHVNSLKKHYHRHLTRIVFGMNME